MVSSTKLCTLTRVLLLPILADIREIEGYLMAESHDQELLSAAQAAEYLGLTRQRIYELADAGRMGHRIGTLWIFSRAELDLYKQERALRPRGGRPKGLAPSLNFQEGAISNLKQ